jgi:hypothetical protein
VKKTHLCLLSVKRGGSSTRVRHVLIQFTLFVWAVFEVKDRLLVIMLLKVKEDCSALTSLDQPL